MKQYWEVLLVEYLPYGAVRSDENVSIQCNLRSCVTKRYRVAGILSWQNRHIIPNFANLSFSFFLQIAKNGLRCRFLNFNVWHLTSCFEISFGDKPIKISSFHCYRHFISTFINEIRYTRDIRAGIKTPVLETLVGWFVCFQWTDCCATFKVLIIASKMARCLVSVHILKVQKITFLLFNSL